MQIEIDAQNIGNDATHDDAVAIARALTAKCYGWDCRAVKTALPWFSQFERQCESVNEAETLTRRFKHDIETVCDSYDWSAVCR